GLRLRIGIAQVLQRLRVVLVVDRIAELPHRAAVPDLELLLVVEQAHLLQLIAGGPGPGRIALVVARLVPGDSPEEVSVLAEVDQLPIAVLLLGARKPDLAALLQRGMEAGPGRVPRDAKAGRAAAEADLDLAAN